MFLFNLKKKILSVCQETHALEVWKFSKQPLFHAIKVLAFIWMSVCKVAYRQFKITYTILTFILRTYTYIYRLTNIRMLYKIFD